MNIVTFFGSVWLAIFFGIFVLAMIAGCMLDRNEAEAPKWWVFFIGLAIYSVYNWNAGYRPSLESFLTSDLWRIAGIYLAIGLAYSLLEFALDIRRSARFWKERWTNFRDQPKFSRADRVAETPEAMAKSFVSSSYRKRIVGVEFNAEAKDPNEMVVPKIDRSELAASIGCWMIFWPFYAISLIIGDLLTEIARVAADVFAKISGRFVRMSFANVFKF